jgi:hypothetical protein
MLFVKFGLIKIIINPSVNPINEIYEFESHQLYILEESLIGSPITKQIPIVKEIRIMGIIKR